MQGVRAVDRAIEILQCFTPDKPMMSVLEIQQRVPLSRPTLYRLLHTLAQKGMIRAFGEPQRFSLDYGVGRLAYNWTAGIDPIVIGRSIVENLRAKTNETAALFMLRGDQRLCVLEMAAPHILRISWGIGEAQPVTSGASGKAILAFTNPDDIEELLKGMSKIATRKSLLARPHPRTGLRDQPRRGLRRRHRDRRPLFRSQSSRDRFHRRVRPLRTPGSNLGETDNTCGHRKRTGIIEFPGPF